VEGRQPSEAKDSVDYARRLWQNTLDWYRSADAKAQILLALDGAFISFLTSSVFKTPEDLAPIIQRFRWPTWLLLGLMALALAGSIVCAMACLWSRLYSADRTRKEITDLGVNPADAATYRPEVMWFFQLIANLDKEQFQKRMLTVTPEFEVQALANDTFQVARNVAQKHTWVNLGFLLGGSALVLFLGAATAYLLTP